MLLEELDELAGPDALVEELDLPADEEAAVVFVLPGAGLVVLALGGVVVVEKLGAFDDFFPALLCEVGVVLELHAAAVSAIAMTASTACQARLRRRLTGDDPVAAGFVALVTYRSFVFDLPVGEPARLTPSRRASARA